MPPLSCKRGCVCKERKQHTTTTTITITTTTIEAEGEIDWEKKQKTDKKGGTHSIEFDESWWWPPPRHNYCTQIAFDDAGPIALESASRADQTPDGVAIKKVFGGCRYDQNVTY